jgi:F420-dependent oxidoreductase-like protein
MQFSFWPTPSLSFEETLQLVTHAEESGWDGIWLADHFMPNAEDTSAPWPEAWTTLAALAASTHRVRLGTLVTGNTYRHPAVLAKMASTLDHISSGRTLLGLGSGWQENEHHQYGIEFGTVASRLERLDEACQVIRALFNDPKANFNGQYYTLTEASLEPKPIQSPLPLLIGGGGEKVTLKITAKYADAWNVWGDPTILRHKMAILDQHCHDVGRAPSEIHRTAVALLFMSDDADFLDNMRKREIAQPHLIGTPEEIKALVDEYQSAGVGELIVPDFTMGNTEQKIATMDKFMHEVAGR